MAEKILVIDDYRDIAKLIQSTLKPRGLLTYHAVDGQDGLKQAYELQPDLIIGISRCQIMMDMKFALV